MQLKIINTTIAKQSTAMASKLEDRFKTTIAPGVYSILKIERSTNGHYKVSFPSAIASADKHAEYQTWMLWGDDLEVPQEIIAKSSSIELGLSYRNQRNNALNPDGACNVTSMAMAFEFLGAKRKFYKGQFEDELYEWCEDHGYSRHEWQGLHRLAKDYGVVDDFRSDATLEQIKSHIRSGNPAVIHGYFTDFGHIVAVGGCNDDGLLICDPFGEWFDWGYDKNDRYSEDGPGRNVFYSNELITATCDRDGIWAHLLSR